MKVIQLSDVYVIHSVLELKQQRCLRGVVTQFDEEGRSRKREEKSQSGNCPASIKHTVTLAHSRTQCIHTDTHGAHPRWHSPDDLCALIYPLLLSPLQDIDWAQSIWSWRPTFSNTAKPIWWLHIQQKTSKVFKYKQIIFCQRDLSHSTSRNLLLVLIGGIMYVSEQYDIYQTTM